MKALKPGSLGCGVEYCLRQEVTRKETAKTKIFQQAHEIAKNCCVTTNNPCAKPPRLPSKPKRILGGCGEARQFVWFLINCKHITWKINGAHYARSA
jgi:hypothetical protein